MERTFFDIHNHTEFSNINGFLDSTIKVKNLLLKASELGYKGVAINDHANISAHIQTLWTTKELKKEGKIPDDFVVALGVEGYVVDEAELTEAIEQKKSTTFYHTILVAKDEIGHQQLRKLTTLAYKRSLTHRGVLRIPMFYSDFEDVIGDDKGHLIVTSACLGGYMGKKVTEMLSYETEEERQPMKQDIYKYMSWMLDMFGDDFYLELQPSYNQEQVDYNTMLVKIAKAYQVKTVIATDTHYLSKEDKDVHSAFLTSDNNGKSNRELGDFYNDTYLHTIEEMYEKLSYLEESEIKESIENTSQIADKIKPFDLAHEQIIPKIPLPPKSEWGDYPAMYELAKSFEYINEMIHSEEEQNQYLMNRAFKGLYDKAIPESKYIEKLTRLNEECKELLGISRVKNQPLSAYFITLQKCMELIWEEADSIIGVSRGSAAGWELNFLLDIVQISPLEQGIEMPLWRST